MVYLYIRYIYTSTYTRYNVRRDASRYILAYHLISANTDRMTDFDTATNKHVDASTRRRRTPAAVGDSYTHIVRI